MKSILKNGVDMKKKIRFIEYHRDFSKVSDEPKTVIKYRIQHKKFWGWKTVGQWQGAGAWIELEEDTKVDVLNKYMKVINVNHLHITEYPMIREYTKD